MKAIPEMPIDLPSDELDLDSRDIGETFWRAIATEQVQSPFEGNELVDLTNPGSSGGPACGCYDCQTCR